jgi:hypothetical protein
MIGHYRDIAAHRPAAAGLAIPVYLRGINSSVWQSALHRIGQSAGAS